MQLIALVSVVTFQSINRGTIIVLTADDELMVELVYKVLAMNGAQRSFDSCMQSFAFVLRLATST